MGIVARLRLLWVHMSHCHPGRPWKAAGRRLAGVRVGRLHWGWGQRLPVTLCPQSRWAASCSEQPSPPTSRSAWTSPAPSSGQMGGWCPMPPTSPCTWVPCRRPCSSRFGGFPPAFPGPPNPCPFQPWAVSWPQIQQLGADLHPGDVLLSNHPSAGGSHLPDLTVITPVRTSSAGAALGVRLAEQLTLALCRQVFWPGQTRPVFYVASRGHHADIGGITPGSMPPHSTTLQQEGAVFLSFKLVQGGVFQEEGEWGRAGVGELDAGLLLTARPGGILGHCLAAQACLEPGGWVTTPQWLQTVSQR